MSSFKRKSATRQTLPPGTKTSPASTSTIITSAGIPSLDDILGGGLPLSCSLLVLAPDSHSAYAELVQKYFISQGLSCGQRICIIDDSAQEVLASCMWTPGNSLSTLPDNPEDEEDGNASNDTKIKIAWRYEQMKQFQTTVSSPNQSAEDFCHVFDLTCRIPETVIQSAIVSSHFIAVSVSSPDYNGSPARRVLREITQILEQAQSSAKPLTPLRICIPSLGSYQWGDLSSQDICIFIHSLKILLRRYPHVCAVFSLPPHMCTDAWGGPGWIQKLSWLSDASITLSAFTANPSLLATFPSHHGMVNIHCLPSPHTLAPPSDKFSTLRGLSASGENNLAFKCMRKRLIFETLHLDLEGGVGERRTLPASNSIVLEAANTGVHSHSPISGSVNSTSSPRTGIATVEVQLEKVATVSIQEGAMGDTTTTNVKKAKTKKKVAFMSDRPEMYDF